MQLNKRQGHAGDNDRRDALQEPIGAIAVSRDTQFAAQLPKPQEGFGRLLFRNDKDNLSGHQNDCEQATHAFDGLDAHIFNI